MLLSYEMDGEGMVNHVHRDAAAGAGDFDEDDVTGLPVNESKNDLLFSNEIDTIIDVTLPVTEEPSFTFRVELIPPSVAGGSGGGAASDSFAAGAGDMQPFEVTLCASDLINEIRNVILEREPTCYWTCFSLQLADGTPLDYYSDVKTVMKEVMKSSTGSTSASTTNATASQPYQSGAPPPVIVVRVIQTMYTLVEVRKHVRQLRELINTCSYMSNSSSSGLPDHVGHHPAVVWSNVLLDEEDIISLPAALAAQGLYGPVSAASSSGYASGNTTGAGLNHYAAQQHGFNSKVALTINDVLRRLPDDHRSRMPFSADTADTAAAPLPTPPAEIDNKETSKVGKPDKRKEKQQSSDALVPLGENADAAAAAFLTSIGTPDSGALSLPSSPHTPLAESVIGPALEPSTQWLYPKNMHMRSWQCVESLSTSAWSPPPQWRRIKGDLWYYIIELLEPTSGSSSSQCHASPTNSPSPNGGALSGGDYQSDDNANPMSNGPVSAADRNKNLKNGEQRNRKQPLQQQQSRGTKKGSSKQQQNQTQQDAPHSNRRPQFKTIHVTASLRGFYINGSTRERFDPSCQSRMYQTLVDLLRDVSPKFRRTFSDALRRRFKSDVAKFARWPVNMPHYNWLQPVVQTAASHRNDFSAVEEFNTYLHSPLALRGMVASITDDVLPYQSRDWNEELQHYRAMPRETSEQRFVRSRSIFRCQMDFTHASVRGACAAVDGYIPPANPADEKKSHLFIYHNIFFSLAFDVKDHYKGLGGDAAAVALPNNDLQGLRVFDQIDPPNLYALATSVVDYKGYRVTAQCIIPGILEREIDKQVEFGSVDHGKTIYYSESHHAEFAKVADKFNLAPHSLVDGSGKVHKLAGSLEMKGVEGSDKRQYLLDLVKMTPPDVHFVAPENFEGVADAENVVCKEARQFGFPRRHIHEMAVLRPELVETFVRARKTAFKHINILLAFLKKRESGADEKTCAAGGADVPKDKAADVAATETDKKSVAEGADNGTTADGENGKKQSTLVEENNKQIETTNKPAGESLAENAVKGTAISNANKDQWVKDSQAEVDRLAADHCIDLKRLDDADYIENTRFNVDMYFKCDAKPAHLATTAAEGEAPAVSVDAAAASAAEYAEQEQFVRCISRYLFVNQIQAIIRELADEQLIPCLPQSLCNLLHVNGINMRYLGTIARSLQEDYPDCKQHVLAVVVFEMVVRAAKHMFRTFLQNVPSDYIAEASAHFLNCFLSSNVQYLNSHNYIAELLGFDAVVSRLNAAKSGGTAEDMESRNDARHTSGTSGVGPDFAGTNLTSKRSGNVSEQQQDRDRSANSLSPTALAGGRVVVSKRITNRLMKSDTSAAIIATLTPQNFWQQLCEEIEVCYGGYKLTAAGIDELCRSLGLARTPLLRRLCKTIGLVLQLRDYDFYTTRGSNATFRQSDVVTFVPIGKSTLHQYPELECKLAYAERLFRNLQILKAIDEYQTLINLASTYYIGVQAELSHIFYKLGMCYLMVQMFPAALCHIQKAVVAAEKCDGLDDEKVLVYMMTLGLTLFMCNLRPLAAQFFMRARYLFTLICPSRSSHPELVRLDCLCGLIHHSIGMYKEAQQFFASALDTIEQSHYAGSLSEARVRRYLARNSACMNEFRGAIAHQKYAITIYEQFAGKQSERTADALKEYEHYVQQGINWQKMASSRDLKGRAAVFLGNFAYLFAYTSGELRQHMCDIMNVVFLNVQTQTSSPNGTAASPQQQQQFALQSAAFMAQDAAGVAGSFRPAGNGWIDQAMLSNVNNAAKKARAKKSKRSKQQQQANAVTADSKKSIMPESAEPSLSNDAGQKFPGGAGDAANAATSEPNEVLKEEPKTTAPVAEIGQGDRMQDVALD